MGILGNIVNALRCLPDVHLTRKSRARFYPRFIPMNRGRLERNTRDVPLIRGTWEPLQWITRKTNPLNPPYQGDLGKGTRRGKLLAAEGWHVCKDLLRNT